jgi:hypothetical protein
MSDFYVTLLSDSSGKFFPDNTIAHFRTKLAQRISAGDDWKVGLAEIYFPKLNMPVDPEPVTEADPVEEEESSKTPPPPSPSNCPVVRVRACEDVVINLKAKTYSLKELLTEIYEAVPSDKRWMYIKGLHDWFQRKLSNEYNSIPHVNPSPINCTYTFVDIGGNLPLPLPFAEYSLEELLTTIRVDIGNTFRRGEFDMQFMKVFIQLTVPSTVTEVVAPDEPTSQVFVYLDVISPQFLGDTMAKCLRVVMGDKGNHQIFIHPYYMSLEKNDFDTMEVKLMNKMGNLYPFKDSINPSSVVLHFIRNSE